MQYWSIIRTIHVQLYTTAISTACERMCIHSYSPVFTINSTSRDQPRCRMALLITDIASSALVPKSICLKRRHQDLCKNRTASQGDRGIGGSGETCMQGGEVRHRVRRGGMGELYVMSRKTRQKEGRGQKWYI